MKIIEDKTRTKTTIDTQRGKKIDKGREKRREGQRERERERERENIKVFCELLTILTFCVKITNLA